jgi:hypothetical protein
VCHVLGEHHRITVIADVIGIAPELDYKYIKTLTRFDLFRCFSVQQNNEGKTKILNEFNVSFMEAQMHRHIPTVVAMHQLSTRLSFSQ